MRWWSGPNGAYLTDHIHRSLLVARSEISDEAIEAAVQAADEAAT
jgi:hypothetical protein